MECKTCGAPLQDYQAFCSKCGEVTSRGAPFAAQLVFMISRSADLMSDRFGQFVAYVTRPQSRTKVIACSAGILLLGVALSDNPLSHGVSSLFANEPAGPQLTADGLPDFASYEDIFISEEARYFVTDPANVRNFPTSQGSEIVSALSGGEEVVAREVMALDRTSQWFKLSSGGYVWGRNLLSIAQIEHEAGYSFPDALVGRWSDRASCGGAARDSEIELSFDSVSIGRAQYGMVDIISAGEEPPAYELVELRNGLADGNGFLAG